MNLRLCFILLCFCTLVACTDSENGDTINIEALFAGKKVECNSNLEIQGSVWEIDTFAWFISEITAQTQGGNIPLLFEPSQWQTNDSALLNLSHQDCKSAINTRLHFTHAIPSDTQQLAFKVGLPFRSNHNNMLSQPTPLNMPFMFWSWQSGHKFLRLDMSSSDKSWSFHLGSVGCQSASHVRPPLQKCLYPNYIEVVLPYVADKALVFKLDKFLESIDLKAMSSCMFQSSNVKSCEMGLNNLQQGVFAWQ